MVHFEKYGIDPKDIRGGKAHCPKYSGNRKNKRDRSLSVDVKTGLFNCHNAGCDFRGCAMEIKKERREYVKPPARLEKLSSKSIEFFDSRGISNNTTLRFGITEAREWMPQFDKEVPVICFNYHKCEDCPNPHTNRHSIGEKDKPHQGHY